MFDPGVIGNNPKQKDPGGGGRLCDPGGGGYIALA